jgi:DNA-directed RNA polymerase I, II, and III subunit RPABC2
MVKILKTYIYDIVDIVKKVKIENNENDDIDDDFLIDDDDEIELIDDLVIDEIDIILENDDENDDDEDDIIADVEDEIEDEIELKEIENKKTFNYLTKYEQCFLLGTRIQQIMNGSPIFIDTNKLTHVNPTNIAYQELIEKKIPFKIKRTLPNGNIEKWDLEDLIIL